MANQKQLHRLQSSTPQDWNAWRMQEPEILIDLSGADLSGTDLSDTNLSGANLSRGNLSDDYLRVSNLSGANLSGANLIYANLSGANLRGANLRGAYLSVANLSRAHLNDANLRNADLRNADLHDADLHDADLRDADLRNADLSRARLNGADLSHARAGWTVLGNVDLRTVKGLETVKHEGPSTIGIDSIIRSGGDIPEEFLRGAGVSERIIAFIRSLIGKPTEYCSCFISYSSKDQEFVERLYADLQNKGVRCWLDKEDLKTGDKIRDRIDQSIRVHDKLLLVLSQHSVNSTWVEFEVEAALAKEANGNALMLFPIRLDSAVKESRTSWATHIRRTRHITDFSNWKQNEVYQKMFTRLLRDLKPETPPGTTQE